MTQEQIRADFEAEAVKFSDVIEFTRDHARGRPDCYVDFTAQCAWEFWQAAHASYAPREKELERRNGEPVEDALEHELNMIEMTLTQFDTPAAAINELISWNVAVAEDPKVNGGKVLVPVEPTVVMEAAGAKSLVADKTLSYIDAAHNCYKKC